MFLHKERDGEKEDEETECDYYGTYADNRHGYDVDEICGGACFFVAGYFVLVIAYISVDCSVARA